MMKKFSQEEVNRIVNVRLKRERERLTKEVQNKIKRCMASIHLILHQEMCAWKRNIAAEPKDPIDPAIWPIEAVEPVPPMESEKKDEVQGGERQ